jgi:hypothetical protein
MYAFNVNTTIIIPSTITNKQASVYLFRAIQAAIPATPQNKNRKSGLLSLQIFNLPPSMNHYNWSTFTNDYESYIHDLFQQLFTPSTNFRRER